jgi:acyl-CoA synthetase (AMP-forming)/AMP-acid ligase II
VLEAAVFGIPDEQWGERVRAATGLKPDMTATEDQIIARTRAYKQPLGTQQRSDSTAR